MAEGKAYYKDYDVEIPETLSAYGYGDSPLTFVSLSDYNGMRKLQGMDSVDLLENNYRIYLKFYIYFLIVRINTILSSILKYKKTLILPRIYHD